MRRISFTAILVLALSFGAIVSAVGIFQRPTSQVVGGATSGGVVSALLVDPDGTLHVVGTSGSPLAVVGDKSANAVVPGATNVGTLPCVANAAVPTDTETFQVPCSVTLRGNLRVSLPPTTSVTTGQLGFTTGNIASSLWSVSATSNGIIDRLSCQNPNASTDAYVLVYNNTASAITVGTTAPADMFMAPKGGGLISNVMRASYTNGVTVLAASTTGGAGVVASALVCSAGTYLP